VPDTIGLGEPGVGGGDDRRQVGAADHDLRARVGDVVLELLRLVHRVDGNDDGVGAEHGVERGRELRAVLHEESDPVARLHPRVLQPSGERLGLLAQCPVAERPAEEEVCGALRIAGGGDLEVEPERRRRSDEGARQALGPDGEMRPVGRHIETLFGRHVHSWADATSPRV
jgi:hypothetical protein